jgi:hypothetical protein
MAYFYDNQDSVQRIGKVVADIFCAAIVLVFSVAFFGLAGGLLAFAVAEVAMVGIDFLVPDENASVGSVVR